MDVYFWNRDDVHLPLGFAYQYDNSDFIGRARDKMTMISEIERTVGDRGITLIEVESGPEMPIGKY